LQTLDKNKQRVYIQAMKKKGAKMAEEKQPFLNIPLDSDLDEMVEEMRKAYGNQSRASVGRMAISKLYEEYQHMQTLRSKVEPKVKEVSRK
jgi:hypothetical protein